MAAMTSVPALSPQPSTALSAPQVRGHRLGHGGVGQQRVRRQVGDHRREEDYPEGALPAPKLNLHPKPSVSVSPRNHEMRPCRTVVSSR